MRFPLRCVGWISAGLITASLGPAAAAAPDDTCASEIAAARAYSAEGSHALACKAYAAARQLALNDDQRHWCDLWVLEEGVMSNSTLTGREDEDLHKLLSPYDEGKQKRDAYWAEAREAEARLADRNWQTKTKADQIRLEVATFWSGQAPLPEASAQFAKSLVVLGRQITERAWYFDESGAAAGRTLLRAASRTLLDAIDRAHAAILYAQCLEASHYPRPAGPDGMRPAAVVDESDITAAYEAAVLAAKDTPVAGAALIARAKWEATLPLSRAEGAARFVDADAYKHRLALIDGALAAALPKGPDWNFDQSIAFLRQARENLVTPTLRVPLEQAYFPDAPIQIPVYAQHVREVEFSLYALDLRQLAQTAGNRSIDEVAKALSGLTPKQVWRHPTGIPSDLGYAFSTFPLPDKLQPGGYALIARDPTNPKLRVSAIFLVTRVQAMTDSGDAAGLSLYAFDQESGKLIPALDGFICAGSQIQPFSLSSADRRRVDFSSQPAQIENRTTIIAGEANGQPFLIRRFAGYVAGSLNEWEFLLSSDRPLYRPGETAHWKITARRLVDGILKVPAGHHLQVRANGSDRANLGQWQVTLSSLGTASGDLQIPPQQASTQVSFEIEGRGSGVPFHNWTQAFAIDRFRAPESELEISADSGQIQHAAPGREVLVSLRARYFSGEPIAQAKVDITSSFSPDWSWRSIHPGRTSVSGNQFNRTSESSAVTDSNGHAVVPIDLPADAPQAFQVSIDARLSAGGDQSHARCEFRVLPHGYAVTIQSGDPATKALPVPPRLGYSASGQPSALYGEPGHPVALALIARDGRDAPAMAHGKVDIYRRDWEEIWRRSDGEILTGAAVAREKSQSFDWPPRSPESGKPWELIHSGYRRELVETHAIETGADGNASLQTTALGAGCYQVVFTPAGERAVPDDPFAEFEILVADGQSPDLNCKPEFAPRVIPCSSVQPVGQPLRALVILPIAGRAVLLQASGTSVRDSRVEWVPGNTAIVEFPWKPEYWAGAAISATVLAPDGGKVGFGSIQISRASNSLQVAVDPDSSQPRPGGKARLQLRISDDSGKPVSGEASIAVADASVASLSSGIRPTPENTFLREAFVFPRRIDSSPRSYRPAAKGNGNLPLEAITLYEGGAAGSPDFIAGSASIFDLGTLSGTRLAAAQAALPMSVGSVTFDVEAKMEPVHVRSQFAYTAYWQPDVAFGPDGTATVDFTYPENLTAWQIDVSAVAPGNRFGIARATTRTDLPFQARLRAPLSIVAGDTTAVYGVIVDKHGADATASASLTSKAPDCVSVEGGPKHSAADPAGGESTLAWTLRGRSPGEAQLTLTARAGADSDAMELKLPVQEDGFDQRTGVAGRLIDRPLKLELILPDPLDRRRSAVDVQVSPGITPTLIESLPYLIDYPYGCVEQTMSRFLPAVAVAKTLRDIGFKPDEIESRIIPSPAPGRKSPAGLGRLDDVVSSSLSRLTDAQLPSGGFGWWPGGSEDPYMTAYVLRGLNVAAASGVVLPANMHARVFGAIVRMLQNSNDDRRFEAPQRRAWELSAAAAYPAPVSAEQRQTLDQAYALLFRERQQLTAAGLALLACSAHDLGNQADIPVLLRNLENGVLSGQSAELGGTAQWGASSNYFDGMDGSVETTALCLEALLQIEPGNPLVDPAANWLLANRQSGHWTNTRDTALALLALNHYAKLRGDATADGSYSLGFNGHSVAERRFSRDSLLEPASFAIDPAFLRPGRNSLTLGRTGGRTPCYVVATAKNWAISDKVRASGSFLHVERSFFRLVEQPTLGGETHVETAAISPDSATALGERVECRLVIEARQDIDYIMVESPKPGGFEPLNPLSGWDAGMRRLDAGEATADRTGRNAYRDEHDDRSVFFLQHLQAGRWEIRYRMRSAFAGDFRALPATAAAMYVPVLAANTTAGRIEITPK